MMSRFRIAGLVLAWELVVLAGDRSLSGQSVLRPGSTPQGDLLRGQDQFLRGMAWFEVGAAQARALDAQTLAAWNQMVQAGYNAYLLERAERAAAKTAMRSRRQAELARLRAETQRRWRENPTLEDIRSGLALNAMASDLADPEIAPSRWRFAQVELPPGFSLESLVFRPASASRPRLPNGSGPSVVALGRMKVGDKWPIALRRPELAAERTDYQRAVAALVACCAQGKPLQAADVEKVRNTLARLRDRAERVIPAVGGLAKQAGAFLGQLDEATRLLLDHDFAEELIRDIEQHQAKTVAQLLAFMKKYRLLLDDAGDDPAAWNVYQKLYELLKSQKIALDFADVAEQQAAEKKSSRERP
jgi:hypothetical protein